MPEASDHKTEGRCMEEKEKVKLLWQKLPTQCGQPFENMARCRHRATLIHWYHQDTQAL